MIIHVTGVKVVGPFTLKIQFDDGIEKTVNLQAELYGEVFEPLRDPEMFAQASVDGYTVVWPNGADFAPEFLYEYEEVEEPQQA